MEADKISQAVGGHNKAKWLWGVVALFSGFLLLLAVEFLPLPTLHGETGDLISGTIGVSLGFVALIFIANALDLQSEATRLQTKSFENELLFNLENRLNNLLDRFTVLISSSEKLQDHWKLNIEPSLNKLKPVLTDKKEMGLVYDFDVETTLSEIDTEFYSSTKTSESDHLEYILRIWNSIIQTGNEIKRHNNAWEFQNWIPVLNPTIAHCMAWRAWKTSVSLGDQFDRGVFHIISLFIRRFAENENKAP